MRYSKVSGSELELEALVAATVSILNQTRGWQSRSLILESKEITIKSKSKGRLNKQGGLEEVWLSVYFSLGRYYKT